MWENGRMKVVHNRLRTPLDTLEQYREVAWMAIRTAVIAEYAAHHHAAMLNQEPGTGHRSKAGVRRDSTPPKEEGLVGRRLLNCSLVQTCP